MEIINDERAANGWITFVMDGRWCEANVYDKPRLQALNQGRIGKLAISRCRERPGMMEFSYDGEVLFDHLPGGVLQKIVKTLEELPQAKSAAKKTHSRRVEEPRSSIWS